MKTIVVAGMLALASWGVAAQDRQSERAAFCGKLGSAYQVAAGYRDQGQDPKDAQNALAGIGLPDKVIKDTINNVYFNPVFERARGAYLGREVGFACIYGPPKAFEPLK